MRKTMRCGALFVLGSVLFLPASAAFAQGAEDAARSQSPQGLTLSAQVFCSETKLRTVNVRLNWSLTTVARDAVKVATLAGAKQTLDTTVYAQGFEKGLYATLPVPAGGAVKVVPAVVNQAPAAQPARETPRAFQIRLLEARPVPPDTRDLTSGEFEVVVEDLEPGVNYTWRLTIETPSGKLVSAPVTVQAPVCPADMIEPRKMQPKKVPPKKPPIAKRL